MAASGTGAVMVFAGYWQGAASASRFTRLHPSMQVSAADNRLEAPTAQEVPACKCMDASVPSHGTFNLMGVIACCACA